jgi:hypothetical protein
MSNKTNQNLEMSTPAPAISDNITLFIDQIIYDLNFSFFVEYGAGNSTIYFLKNIYKTKKRINFISMEYDSKWFLNTVETIKSEFSTLINESYRLKIIPWSYEKCKKYFKDESLANFRIPNNLKRLSKGRKKFAGRLNYKMLTYRFYEKFRPFDGAFSAEIGGMLKLNLNLKRDFIKDQYGESPIKKEYIFAPFQYILKDIEKGKKIIAMFIIDGGPRFDILELILDMEEKNDNFFPVIFLHDANRLFYKKQINRRPNGIYLRGTNRTLNNRVIYEKKKKSAADKTKFTYGKENVTIQELIEKEVWYYNSAEQKKSKLR